MVPRPLIEASLFGYMTNNLPLPAVDIVKLFEQASGGTIFIENIDALDRAVQWMVVVAMRDRTVIPVGAVAPVPIDVRVIAATTEDLAALVAARTFRDDLRAMLGAPVEAE